MPRSMRNVVVAALALVATAACSKSSNEPNPKPPAAQQPAAPAQQPAAQAPAAQAPAEPAAAGGQGGTGGAAAAAAPAAAATVSPAAEAEAKQTFQTVCTTCHGPSGNGDGPAAAGFPVKPRKFSDPEWQKSVTDDHIRKVILEGGPSVGKSPLMPANPQLKDKPEVVTALVQMIRGFGKQ